MPVGDGDILDPAQIDDIVDVTKLVDISRPRLDPAQEGGLEGDAAHALARDRLVSPDDAGEETAGVVHDDPASIAGLYIETSSKR